MEFLQAAPTRHCHTEQVSRILTKRHLTSPKPKREGRRKGWEKKHSTKWQASNKLLLQHFAKSCKQATVYTSHKVPLLEALGHPSIAGKTADQHCFKVNFA